MATMQIYGNSINVLGGTGNADIHLFEQKHSLHGDANIL